MLFVGETYSVSKLADHISTAIGSGTNCVTIAIGVLGGEPSSASAVVAGTSMVALASAGAALYLAGRLSLP